MWFFHRSPQNTLNFDQLKLQIPIKHNERMNRIFRGKGIAASPPINNNRDAIINYGYDWDSVPNVLLYIDNSNIFESAKKHSGHKKGYRNGIPDVACRIDIGKLISKAVGHRRLLFGKLYGSEPPALDTGMHKVNLYFHAAPQFIFLYNF